MPRQSYTSVLTVGTEAQFREWATQLSTALKACLTQTTDTGQMDWARTYSFADDFNRANGAVGNGWTVNGTTPTANIESNKLRLAGATNGALVERLAASQGGTLRVKIADLGSAAARPELLFRFSPTGTIGLAWDPVGGVVRQYATLTSFAVNVSHTPFTPAPTDVLEVVYFSESAMGSSTTNFTCKRNGVAVVSGSAGSLTVGTYTHYGLRTSADATGALFEDFEFDEGVWPYASGTGAYEMYRFSDALQATKPVFIRVEYGHGGTAPSAQVKLSVGTGTNGAGTLTGLIATSPTLNRTAPGGVIGSSTYVCYKDGTFNIAWGVNAGGLAYMSLVAGVTRTKDSNGDSTNNGLLMHHGPASGVVTPMIWIWSFDLNTVTPLTAQAAVPCLVPPGATSGTDPLVNLYNWFIMVPDLYNCVGWLTYKNGEIAAFSEIDVAIVGSTSRHYICLGNVSAQGFSSNASAATDALAMLWEV